MDATREALLGLLLHGRSGLSGERHHEVEPVVPSFAELGYTHVERADEGRAVSGWRCGYRELGEGACAENEMRRGVGVVRLDRILQEGGYETGVENHAIPVTEEGLQRVTAARQRGDPLRLDAIHCSHDSEPGRWKPTL